MNPARWDISGQDGKSRYNLDALLLLNSKGIYVETYHIIIASISILLQIKINKNSNPMLNFIFWRWWVKSHSDVLKCSP
jgi:hypothetical protein